MRPRRRLRDEGLLSMPIETGRFVELQRCLILATGHQHHLVAARGPGRVERFGQQGFCVASAAILRMRHHVLDDPVGPAASREVGNQGQIAAGDQLGALESSEVVEVTTCQDLLPDCLDDNRGGPWIVRLVKVLVEIEQRWQVGLEELASFHVRRGQWVEYLTARGPCPRFSSARRAAPSAGRRWPTNLPIEWVQRHAKEADLIQRWKIACATCR